MSSSGSSEPQDFVWPGRGRRATQDGQRSAGASGAGESGSLAGRGDSGNPSADRGAGGNKPEGGAGAPGPLTGQDLARADLGGLGGSPAKNETAKATGGDEGGSGGLAVASSGGPGSGDQAGGGSGGLAVGSSGGPGFGDQAGGSGSGTSRRRGQCGGRRNGRGCRPRFPTISWKWCRDGWARLRRRWAQHRRSRARRPAEAVPAGGSGSAGSVFQVPTFEPAGDQAGGSTSLGQPGLLSGRGSSGGTGAGVQAPAFGLGQIDQGFLRSRRREWLRGNRWNFPAARRRSHVRRRGPLWTEWSGLRLRLGLGPARWRQCGHGRFRFRRRIRRADRRAAIRLPAVHQMRNRTAPAGQGQGAGQGGRGFDWSEAAKDGPPPGGSDVQGSDPPQGSELTGTDAPPNRPRLPPPRIYRPAVRSNRSSLPANVQLDPANIPYQAGQISQDDIDRAKQLERTQLVREPRPGPEASGSGFCVRFPIRNAVELVAERFDR